MFKKFAEITPAAWGALILLLLVGLGLLTLGRSRQKWTARMLATGAICVALSFILSYIRLYRMLQGGSITPASMLPLLAFAYYFGPAPGILAGVAAGLLQMLQDSWFLNFTQFMLDYPLAFGVLGLAGLFGKVRAPYGLMAGVAVGGFARFLCSLLSGAVFFAEYAGDMNPWRYSMIYNGSYMLPETVICLAIAAIPAVQSALRRIANPSGIR